MSNSLILLTALIVASVPNQLLIECKSHNLSPLKTTSLVRQAKNSKSMTLDMIGSALVKQFQTAAGQLRDRWVHLPLDSSTLVSSSSSSSSSSSLSSSPILAPTLRRPILNLRDQSRLPRPLISPTRPLVPNMTRRQNRLVRALNNLWTQMNARNSIRVHNAFRDLAWRLLGTFSMPTPVIYELRRQHFYPADEDEAQDKLFNRNTTKTIRTKRSSWPIKQISNLAQPRRGGRSYNNNNKNNDYDEEIDDDDSTTGRLRQRLQTRLEDLLSLSRRSLFGRVVRVPSLFPFKREEKEEGDNNDGDNEEQEHKGPGNSSILPLRQRLMANRRKRKEAERQIISINGKQFYVNDEGQLKEMPTGRGREKGRA